MSGTQISYLRSIYAFRSRLAEKLIPLLDILTRTLPLDDDFQIYTDFTALPAGEHEAYLSEGFSGVCTGGTVLIKVFSITRRISRNDLVMILTMQSVSVSEMSHDFSMTFFKVDRTMFLDIMSSLGKITPEFFFYMRRNFLIRLKRDEVLRYTGFRQDISKLHQLNELPAETVAETKAGTMMAVASKMIRWADTYNFSRVLNY